ncbi:hypothetical protein [Cupriavidus pauculus]|uniref:hypothetical protein n=1 Tax=Cupriavidus pauculus TaxID=82633 RepID=UPI001EE1AD23|nr:hypothetical protein [Cupriavidus pauculus]GJG96747.1 hypothetical protein CBA19C6_19680 [Cupriavidus pauculus]
MSTFIAMRAFSDESYVGAAKIGMLIGSFAAGVLGLAWGFILARSKVRGLLVGRSGGLIPDIFHVYYKLCLQ